MRIDELEVANKEAAEWKSQHHKSVEEAADRKRRFDELFEMNKRTNRLLDLAETYRHASQDPGQGQSLIVQKIKPHEPKRFDGSQDLEVVTQFLDDVEHYVRQGGAACQKTTTDNQRIDTLWRFLSTKIFRWFEDSLKKRGVAAIPPVLHLEGKHGKRYIVSYIVRARETLLKSLDGES